MSLQKAKPKSQTDAAQCIEDEIRGFMRTATQNLIPNFAKEERNGF
jgi:hypothetical protein